MRKGAAVLRPGTKKAALEFAGVVFGPAFDDHFFVGVELDGVAALAVHVSEEAVFPSTEREIGHGRGDADVDADVSGGGFVAEAARGGTAGSEERGLIAEGILLEKIHRFIQIFCMNKT